MKDSRGTEGAKAQAFRLQLTLEQLDVIPSMMCSWSSKSSVPLHPRMPPRARTLQYSLLENIWV